MVTPWVFGKSALSSWFAILLIAVAFCLPWSGCGSSSGDTGTGAGSDASTPDGGGTGEDAGAADSGGPALVGAFQVSLVADTGSAPAYTLVIGKVNDGPTPEQIVWEQNTVDGDCRLLKPRVPYCETSCTGGAVCVEDDTCQNYPTAQSVGTVQVTGLRTKAGDTEFSMDVVANSYQPSGDLEIQYPPCDEGADITFAASGSDFTPGFTLQAKGIISLELLNGKITLEKGKGLTLTWTPPGVSGISIIHVKLDISHHGGTKGKIECDAVDTGSLSLSSVLLDKLLNLGVAGYPSIVVTRRSTGSATIAAGLVDLVVGSGVEKPVEIPGVVSCHGDEGCPSGEKCQPNATCK